MLQPDATSARVASIQVMRSPTATSEMRATQRSCAQSQDCGAPSSTMLNRQGYTRANSDEPRITWTANMEPEPSAEESGAERALPSAPWSSSHLAWLTDSGERVTTEDGKEIEVWDLEIDESDDKVLSEWARHFRNHYCLDTIIDRLRRGTNYSRAEYLEKLLFPDESTTPGPTVRSGDFGEILLADYIQYVQKYWVPRWRYDRKAARNTSTHSTDVIGFHLQDAMKTIRDRLITCETKAALTRTKKNKLQEAVDHSAKDMRRKAEALNAIKQRMYDIGDEVAAAVVERFQSQDDLPYTEVSAAAAVLCQQAFHSEALSLVDCSRHPNLARLSLLVIRANRPELMTFVHALYRRACDEA